LDSGTPTAWLAGLSNRVAEVHCPCEPEVAAERFVGRRRHPGHLDGQASYDEVLRSLRAIPRSAIEIGQQLVIDTSREPDLDIVVRDIRAAFLR